MGVFMVDRIDFNKTNWALAFSRTQSAKTQPIKNASDNTDTPATLEKMRRIQEKIESGQYVVNIDQLSERLTNTFLNESNSASPSHDA